MTLLQKIQNLTWWTLDIKLKDILTDLNTVSENTDTRITIIENSTPPTQALQDLQSVLDEGGYADIDDGNSVIQALYGTINNRRFLASMDNGSIGSRIDIKPDYVSLSGYKTPYSGEVLISEGVINFKQYKTGTPFNTGLFFNEPIVISNIKIPAKSVAGNYTINTTPDTTYTVGTLPSGLLNDMAIVTDALAPTYLGALTGGGAVVCPVWHNGTIWVAR